MAQVCCCDTARVGKCTNKATHFFRLVKPEASNYYWCLDCIKAEFKPHSNIYKYMEPLENKQSITSKANNKPSWFDLLPEVKE